MCANYWNLKIKDMACPSCKEKSDWELQTHYMGGDEGGICNDYYELHQIAKPLEGKTMIMDRDSDWFIDSCPKCKKFFDFGAEVNNGKIEKIFLLPRGGD